MSLALDRVGGSSYRLEDQLGSAPGRVTMTGVLALLRAPLDVTRSDARRGLRTEGVVCGYRGSPLATVDMTYEAHRSVFVEGRIHFVDGVNEELAATVLWGAQQALLAPTATVNGVLGLWYGKAPGLDRASDAIRHATLSGVGPTGGVLVAVGDDPECKSSTVPSATEWTLADLAMPTLQPATVQDVLDFGRHGYELSRRCGSWVGLKMHADIADGYATVDVGSPLPEVPAFERDGRPWRATADDRLFAPWSLALEEESLTARLDAAHHYVRAAGLDTTIGGAEASIGIVAAGKTYGDVVTALEALGLGLDDLAGAGIRLYRPALVWPLEPQGLREFTSGLSEIIVVEEKRPFLESQMRSMLYGQPGAPSFSGARTPEGLPLVPTGRVLDIDAIAEVLRVRLAGKVGDRRLRGPRIRLVTSTSVEHPSRTPYFCSGCPHNRSTVVPEGSVAGGGTGCHGMALFTRGRATGTTQMGGEGAQWVGASMFSSEPHRFQNMGDGTLAHSGILAIRQAVSAGTNITFKILANGVVAMTGGQRAAGELSIPSLTRQLEAEGVGRIVVVTDDPRRHRRGLARGVRVLRRDRLDEVQRELREISGVTALIYDQACAAELRRDRKRGRAPTPSTRPMINEAVCEGCGHCGDVSNCLSVHPVETPLGRKTRIHQDSCNLDMSCIEGDCPAFVTVDVRRPAKRTAPDPPGEEVPLEEPLRRSSAVILLAGIGGTGVVTVGQVLATAANLDGLRVSSIDQTGMAQKGGPVVSHLRIGNEVTVGAARVGPGGADILLAFDMLTAVADANLARLECGRTTVVASTTRTPTGAMVADVDLGKPLPISELRARLDDRSRAESNLYFDAEDVAAQAFGSSPASNLLVVGAAYQLGLLPVSSGSIERALELNGVAVAVNVAAFRLGRQIGAGAETLGNPAPVVTAPMSAALATLVDSAQPDESLYECLELRVPELVAYQNERYAHRYLDVVTAARAAELSVAEPTSRYSTVVAEQLFHVMAYKDEYEVARLHRSRAFHEQIEREFGTGAKVTYLLQPPIATKLGLHRKLRVGARVGAIGFWGLAGMKRLRGTWLDPFRRSAERREERALIEEYVELTGALNALVTAGRVDEAVRVAGLVSTVRGFAAIKRRNLDRYRDVMVNEMASLGLV